MVDFLVYRNCNLTDLGVSSIVRRQDDIIERGISILRDPSGVPPDDNDGSDNPTLDIVDATWGAPTDGNGTLPPGTYDYDIVPVDTCTGRTGKPIALPQLTVAGNAAVGTIYPLPESDITDQDQIVVDDGNNPAHTFVFDKQSSKATGEVRLVSASDVTDGDYVIIDDGNGTTVKFEFDKNGSVVDTPTLKGVIVWGSESSAELANTLATVISSSSLGVTATASNNVVTITNNVVGASGNVDIVVSTANAFPTPVITATGMSGGSGVVPSSTTTVIPLNGGESIKDVGVLIREAVQSAPIGISAAGINPISLKNTVGGSSGNVPITQSGSGAFDISGMSGGSGTGQVAVLQISLGDKPSKCDAAMIRRNGVVVGPVFPLEDIPEDVTTITLLEPTGTYDLVGNTDDADDPNKAKGSRSFRRTGGADLIGGDVILYNGVAVKVTKVVGSGAPQIIEFEPPIPSTFTEPPGFFDPSNRGGFYEGISTTFSALGNIPFFGGVLSPAQYAPMWPPLSGIYWPGPVMSFKTIPNHVLLPQVKPFFNDLQEGDIIAYGSKTALVVYVERNVLSIPPLTPLPGDPAPGPQAGTVLLLPFGLLPIPPLPAGQFWIIHRSLNAPEFGFYYSAYDKPSYPATTPPAPDDGVDPTAGLPLFGGFTNFDDAGPTKIRGGIAADGGVGSGYAQGQINVDATGNGRVLPLDGETLDITDGSSTVTFEFDADSSVVETPTLRQVALPTVEYPVTSVDLLNQKMFVATDLTPDLSVGDTVFVVGSTGNDGTYTIASISYVSSTELTFNQPIPDGTPDGNVRFVKGDYTDVVNALLSAINGAPGFGVAANVYAATNSIDLRNTVAPSTGGTAIVSTVSDPEFVVSGMSINTVNFSEFLPKDAFVANSPSSAHHRLNAFRVLGDGQGGMGPPSALKSGQMILIDGSLVTVNEVTELIPPDGFASNPLPGFPGTYEVHFTGDLSPDPQTLFPVIAEVSRPITPVGPWVTVPSFTSPFIKKPDIKSSGTYERISRRTEIKQSSNTWQWEEDGSYQVRSGTVDGTAAKDELDKIFTQNGYSPGLSGLLSSVRGASDTKVSDAFVSTNGDLTQVGDRLIAVNDLADDGTGTVISLPGIRLLHDDVCSSFQTLTDVQSALQSDPAVVIRLTSVDTTVAGPTCPPGQPSPVVTNLVCQGLATPDSPVQESESIRVIWSPSGRTSLGSRDFLIKRGLTDIEADGAIKDSSSGRVVNNSTASDQVLLDILDLADIGPASDIDLLLAENRIDRVNNGRLNRPMIQSMTQRRGTAGIVQRAIGTDWLAASKGGIQSLVSDFAIPTINLAAKSFILQGSFDVCNYQAALDSLPDGDVKNRFAALFAVVENVTKRIKDAGEVLVSVFYGDQPFVDARDVLAGILTGAGTDPNLGCLAGPITATGDGSLGVTPRGTFGRLDSLIGDFSEDFLTRFRLTGLMIQAVNAIICQATNMLEDTVGEYGGETPETALKRAIGCLPTQEALIAGGIDFPSVEVEAALLCSNDLLSIYGDIVVALLAEVNEAINLGNSMGSGFVTDVVESTNRMCSSDQSLSALVGGLRAQIGLG